MAPLSDDKEAEIIQAFNSTSRYLDNLKNIASVTKAPFMAYIYLHVFYTDLFHTRYNFDYDIVNFLFSLLVTFPVLPPTGFTFLNLFGSLECLVR